jgi:hypothetical protein
MKLYSCLWRRGTAVEQPFILHAGGSMRLTTPPAQRRAIAAYQALAGERDDAVLLNLMACCKGTIARMGITKREVIMYGVQRALFWHCFPAFIGHHLSFSQNYSYHSCGKGNADRSEVKLQFPGNWWWHVYLDGQAVTPSGDFVLGTRCLNGMNHRYVVRPMEEERMTLRIEEQWQMQNGEWQ